MTSPSIFGPPLWFNLHIMAINYAITPSIDEQEQMYLFLSNLPAIIPCKKCKTNLSIFLFHNRAKMRQHVASRNALFEFILQMHNNVNSRLNKPQWSLIKAIEHYKKYKN